MIIKVLAQVFSLHLVTLTLNCLASYLTKIHYSQREFHYAF